MLYAKYSCPMDLMSRYINQGRFGTFVHDFITMEYERRKQEAEKEHEWRLWTMYIHSWSDEPYDEWKARVCKTDSTTDGGTTQGVTRDKEMTEQDARAIYASLFPDG